MIKMHVVADVSRGIIHHFDPDRVLRRLAHELIPALKAPRYDLQIDASKFGVHEASSPIRYGTNEALTARQDDGAGAGPI